MIVKMKKLCVVGLLSEEKKILDILRATGCFELSEASAFGEAPTATMDAGDNKQSEELRQRLHILETAITNSERARAELDKNSKLISELGLPALPKNSKPLFACREDVAIEDLSALSEKGEEILQNAQKLNEKRERIEKIDALCQSLKAEAEELQFFKNVDAPLSDIKDTKNIFMLLGALKKKSVQRLVNSFCSKSDFTCNVFEGDKHRSIIFVSGPIEQKTDAIDLLKTEKFEQCHLECDILPLKAIERTHNKIVELKKERYGLLCEMLEQRQMKLYYDSIVLELESIDAQKSILQTKKTFALQGWVPVEDAQKIVEKIQQASTFVECELLDAMDDEEPPTLTRSNALVSPYEAVTNMYSPPNPNERDPNPFVGIFFFIFFGIMIGDAIYGLALFALTFVLMRCYKMETGFKKLMMILCMGGVSAFIWGAVYNSWAAIGLPYNPIINPVEHPFDFLIIALGLGYVQITFGFVLKLIANIRARDFVSALADSGWKLLIMLGGALNLPSMLQMFTKQFAILSLPSLPAAVCYIGLAMIGIGLVGMLLTGGRSKNTISGKIISGVGSWYDLVGLLSDILSYCRLFGLALSGAIIGMVANILAMDVLFEIPIVGYALGIIVAIFFHIFNLALAVLGAYVHNSRLQFVEFFGKFYEGGGRSFAPMGRSTKYTMLKRQ